MTKRSPFHYFKMSEKIMRMAVVSVVDFKLTTIVTFTELRKLSSAIIAIVVNENRSCKKST